MPGVPASRRVRRGPQSGVSLIMVSILLAVASVIMVSFLPGKEAGSYHHKAITTVEKMAKIEWAMTGFMAAYGRRPCPADGQYRVDQHEFGLEAANPGTCTGGSPAVPLGPDAGTGNIVAGVVPTKTLNIPDEYAFDGWGRRITYAVDRRATDAATCPGLQNYPTNDGEGDIDIHDSSGAVSAETTYALISHGPDGHGAWPMAGSSVANRLNIGSIDTATLNNASVDASFAVSFDNIIVRKSRTATFDDIVYFRPDLKNTCCVGAACMVQRKGFRIDGERTKDEAGAPVTIGDINGDGIQDVIVVAERYDADNPPYGAVYVIFGQAGPTSPSPFLLSSIDGSNGFRLVGEMGWKGPEVAAVGDVNGDGFDDLIIGEAGRDVGSEWGAGSVAVVFGKAAGWAASSTLDDAFLDGTNGFRLDGNFNADETGTYVAAGDFNGDGLDDILVSAPSQLSNDKGAVYLVFGKAAGWAGTEQMTCCNPGDFINGTNGVRFDGTQDDQLLGGPEWWEAAAMMTAADVNDDGFDDAIIGSPMVDGAGENSGSVFVIFGRADWSASARYTLDGTFVDGANAFQLEGEDEYYYIGGTAAAGDLNGDGKADIIMSNSAISPVSWREGSVFIVFGKAGGWGASHTLDVTFLDGTNGVRFDGSDEEICLGGSLGSGDVNDDGIDDLLIGATGQCQDTGPDAGAYVVFGKAAGWASAVLDGTIINGTDGFHLDAPSLDDHTGSSVAASDVNGDGYADMIVGAHLEDYTGSKSGSAYVVFGKVSGWSTQFNLSDVGP